MSTSEITTCYRHADRRAGVSCQRCSRPICPSCMVQASVGFHCPECSKRGAQKVITPNSLMTRPIVTMVLIAINAAAFVADIVSAQGASLLGGGGSSVSDQGLLIGIGTFDRVNVVGVATGEWYRIFTSGFLHAGLLHLAMNMLVLWLVGSQLEQALGKARYLALYITGLIAGAFGVLLISPTSATVGASGAIFALFGGLFFIQRSRGINPFASGLGGLIILNIATTFLIPGISIGGHIGGLVGGAVAGYAVVEMEKRVKNVWAGVAVCAVLSVALFFGCIWAADQWRDPVLAFLDR